MVNVNEDCYEILEPVEEEIKQQVIASPVAHFDETGICIGCSIFKGLLDSKINDYFWQHTPILDQAYTFGTLARASSTFSLGYS
ncbi:MAG: hypothetical protein AAGB97_05515 [Dehalococcoidia bacterium]|nr:hypothetical protein [Chloroflexota bacterium]MBT9161478.1 hypothetical protein [Chloroflexota bacterium]